MDGPEDKLIIAFDPGHTTGVCLGRLTGARTFDVVDSLVIDWQDRHQTLADLFDTYQELLVAVVVESFRLFQHAAQSQINNEFPSVRFIGALEHALFNVKLSHLLVFQQPSQRTNVTIKEHITSLVRSPHARDAYLHLKYYILTKGKDHF